jgi:hypothetical protein
MTITRTLVPANPPVLVIDGAESMEGRALFVISALAGCLDWLPSVTVRFADVIDENVVTALDVFRHDHGIQFDVRHPADRTSPLRGADLYAAVAFRSAGHLRLGEAQSARIPTLLAIQFPEPEWVSPSVLLRRAAAFDPRRFAADLGAIVTPWLS